MIVFKIVDKDVDKYFWRAMVPLSSNELGRSRLMQGLQKTAHSHDVLQCRTHEPAPPGRLA